MLGVLDKIQVLRKEALFQGITFEDLITIARISTAVLVEPGTVMFKQGEPGDCLYVVVYGHVTIIIEGAKGPVTVADLKSKGCFGEMSLLDEQPRSATILVSVPTLLLRIGKSDFRELLRRVPDLGLELLRILSSRIRRIQMEAPKR